MGNDRKAILLTTLGVTLLTLLAGLAGLFRSPELQFSDTLLALHENRHQPRKNDIVFAVITDSALKYADKIYKMGWPWRRKYYGKLTEMARLFGAKTTVFDIIFSERSVYRVREIPPYRSEDDDGLFGEAIRRNGRTVLGFGALFRGTPPPIPARFALPVKNIDKGTPIKTARSALVPVPVLINRPAALGAFFSEPDPDNRFRRIPPMIRIGKAVYPTLALAAWQTANPDKQYRLEDGHLLINGKQIPLDSRGRIRVRYHGDNNIYYDINILFAFLAHDKIRSHYLSYSRLHYGKPPLSLEEVCRTRENYSTMLSRLNNEYMKGYSARFRMKTGAVLPTPPSGKGYADNPGLILAAAAKLPDEALARLGGNPAALRKSSAKLTAALEKAGLYGFKTLPLIGIKRWKTASGGIRREPLRPWILTGKHIIVGSISQGLQDIVATPFNPQEAGMHVHASLLDNLIHGEGVRELDSPILGLLLIILAAGVSAWAGYRLPWKTAAAATLLLLMLLFGTAAILAGGGIILFPLTPAAAVLLTVLVTATVNRIRDRAQRQYLLHAFGQYLSPKVIETLLANPDKLELGGERKEMTAMFTDLQGFSSISEGLSPEELVTLLNDYLSRMCEIIASEGGIIDKFEGDAIIAFWGAPLGQDDHAALACRAAIRMQEDMVALREEFRTQNRPELHMRIGINTGPMVVGNLGSHQRMDYTIMGDAVNLASRLEGANKLYNTWILASEHTLAAVGGRFLVREVDRIRVVGKSEPVTVFELLDES